MPTSTSSLFKNGPVRGLAASAAAAMGPSRPFVPPCAGAAAVWLLLALAAAMAATTMIVLLCRYRITSRRWIDLRTTPTELPPNSTGKGGTNQYRTVIVTGGSSGLGYHVARDVAVRRGFGTIVLGCRDVTKGRQAADRIARDAARRLSSSSSDDVLSCRVECVPLDLASLSSVVKFAETVTSRYRNIHAVVLNAGVWVPMDKEWKTHDKYEIHFGVNHLAHQLLAQLLVPHLQQQQQQQQQGEGGVSGSRIVWVTSSLLRHGHVNLEDAEEFLYKGRKATASVPEKDEGKSRSSTTPSATKGPPSFCPTGYCDSKLMNALACRHLASTLESSSVGGGGGATGTLTTYAVCPGFCRTDLGRYAPFSWWKKMLLAPLFWAIQRPAELGAQGIVYCTLEDPQQLVNGGLYRDGRILWEDPGGTAHVDRFVEDGTAQRLWDLCSSLLKAYLPETK